MPLSSTMVNQSTIDLSQLIDNLHSRELSDDPLVQFVRGGFVVLTKRIKECSMGVKKGLYCGGNVPVGMR